MPIALEVNQGQCYAIPELIQLDLVKLIVMSVAMNFYWEVQRTLAV